MAAATSPTFDQMMRSVRDGAPSSVYLLHGEESYFIDELVRRFENILPENERAFDMTVVYAPDTTPGAIADTCRRFPVTAKRQVGIVKELQSVDSRWRSKLCAYLEKPSPTTLLVMASRGEAVKPAEVVKAVKKGEGVVFESTRLRPAAIAPTIEALVRNAGLHIEPKGIAMLTDYIGVDAAKLYNEIGKMAMILGKGATITPESIERNIGVSKDYNNFELIDAIASKDARKAFAIADYFAKNPKPNPTVVTIAALFTFFSDLLIAHFTKDKSPSGLKSALGLKWDVQLKKFSIALPNYNAFKVIEIISAIRKADVQSKGVGSRQNAADLLHDLIFRILTCQGDISF
ncbi:DNA polymerase III subunit delta [Paramuribaculum intestinale]|uniref:DNA polymerase III subunit delta n=1 Tax=Paramuribaculum intestinale TaxID=2094151 RepID=UPI0025B73137|nr:DNA polymerase III subunit delta [Paramuribaculum intestinale]